MNLIKSIVIAASGLTAQSARMRVIAENLANVNSTASTPNGRPYTRQVATFKDVLDRETGVSLVKMDKTVKDKTEYGKRYEPGHPAADAEGYVKTPNVNSLIEMMDMQDAQRTYEAGLNVIGAARQMMARTLDLLRS
jgi:flagellar basal-body rod protein FlgC